MIGIIWAVGIINIVFTVLVIIYSVIYSISLLHFKIFPDKNELMKDVYAKDDDSTFTAHGPKSIGTELCMGKIVGLEPAKPVRFINGVSCYVLADVHLNDEVYRVRSSLPVFFEEYPEDISSSCQDIITVICSLKKKKFSLFTNYELWSIRRLFLMALILCSGSAIWLYVLYNLEHFTKWILLA